jgi:hypothetical protein
VPTRHRLAYGFCRSCSGAAQAVRYTAVMGILIGMDEAGYGPQLGPLVVAATAWEVGEQTEVRGQKSDVSNKATAGGVSLASAARPKLGAHDLYRSLRAVVSRSSSERKIAIADSKVLYKPGLGLRQLERGVHAVLLAMEQSLASWSEIVDGCRADTDAHHRRLPWHDGFNCRLPVDAVAEELAQLGERLARACDGGGVRPLAIRARLVFPAEFNQLCEYYGNKAAALSHVTIGLLREVVECAREAIGGGDAPARDVFALCDKHGGRNFYTALLQHHFSEHWIQPVYESHAESRYEWGPETQRMHVAFCMQGERFMPTALASMTAKYFRELSMRAFNEYWCARVPGLRPTAGYYGDSTRFRREIAAQQRALAIDDHVLWRNR